MANVLILQSPPPKLEDVQKKLFSKGAVEFLWKLHRKFSSEIDQLYQNRLARIVELQSGNLNFKKSPERDDKSWKIGPLPIRLQYV